MSIDITPYTGTNGHDITPYTSTNRHHSLYRYQWTSLPILVPMDITPYDTGTN